MHLDIQRVYKKIDAKDSAWLEYLSLHNIKIDSHRPQPRAEGDTSFRVLNLFSVPPLLMAPIEQVIASADAYDLILTYSDELCAKIRHAVLFPFGSRWVKKGNTIRDEGVSYIFSEGGAQIWDLPGYHHRVEVLRRLQAPDAPAVEVHYSTRRPMRPSSRNALVNLFERGLDIYPLGLSKLPAFERRYQIVIENFSVRNWFTEKIVDCFTRNVTPIYIGCPNIGDFFDARGILQCTNVDEIFDVLRRLSDGETLYNAEAVATNHEICDYYDDTRVRAMTLIESEVRQRKLVSVQELTA